MDLLDPFCDLMIFNLLRQQVNVQKRVVILRRPNIGQDVVASIIHGLGAHFLDFLIQRVFLTLGLPDTGQLAGSGISSVASKVLCDRKEHCVAVDQISPGSSDVFVSSAEEFFVSEVRLVIHLIVKVPGRVTQSAACSTTHILLINLL